MGCHGLFHLAGGLMGGGAHPNAFEAEAVLQRSSQMRRQECFPDAGVTPNPDGVDVGVVNVGKSGQQDVLLGFCEGWAGWLLTATAVGT